MSKRGRQLVKPNLRIRQLKKQPDPKAQLTYVVRSCSYFVQQNLTDYRILKIHMYISSYGNNTVEHSAI